MEKPLRLAFPGECLGIELKLPGLHGKHRPPQSSYWPLIDVSKILLCRQLFFGGGGRKLDRMQRLEGCTKEKFRAREASKPPEAASEAANGSSRDLAGSPVP